MSRVYFIADVHVGNHKRFGGEPVCGVNQRCQEVLEVLTHAAKVATDEVLVILGDLFDSPRPSPQVLAKTMRALRHPRRVVVLAGNHDRASGEEGDNALAPLKELPNIEVVEAPQLIREGEVGLLCVPFLPHQTADTIEQALIALAAEKHVGTKLVACIHAGIKDADTPPWLADSTSAVPVARLMRFAEANDVSLVVAGDWHEHRAHASVDGTIHVVQCGALVPTGWDNAGLKGYGSLIEVSPREPWTLSEVPGPRFVKGSLPSIIRAAQTHSGGYPLRAIAVVGDSEEEALAKGLDNVVEVVRADEDVRGQAQQASQAARSASTLEEALARYVREMPLPEDVTSPQVLESVRGYLARAGGQDAG